MPPYTIAGILLGGSLDDAVKALLAVYKFLLSHWLLHYVTGF